MISIKMDKYRRTLLKTSLLAVIIFFSVLNIQAQNGVLSEFGINTRAMAMGNAVSSVADLGPLGFYNPALSAFQSNDVHTDFLASSMSFDRRLSAVNVGLNLPPKAGLNIYLQGFSVSNIQERSSSGYHVRDFRANEFRLGTAFALRLSKKLAFGVGLKINRSQLHPEITADPSIGLDAGFHAQLTNKWYISGALMDMLSSYTWNTADYYGEQQSANQVDSQPFRVVLGSSYRTSKLLASIDFEQRRITAQFQRTNFVDLDGSAVGFREDQENTYWLAALRLGLAYQIHERIQMQAGYALQDLESSQARWSTGFNLALPFDQFKPRIQYTLVREAFIHEFIHSLGLQLQL